MKFQKKKLALHRASMLYLKDKLESLGFVVRYLAYENEPDRAAFFQRLAEDQIQNI